MIFPVRPFTYRKATSLTQAAQFLDAPDAVALGGGTDLLVCIEEGLATPATLVDLRALPGEALAPQPDGGFRIAASTRVHDLATDPRIREQFPALTQACDSVGSPALRHMGTIGGNLCQRPRCRYLRRGISCFKNGGSSCPARQGENQYHAILDGGPCFVVHPSDPAVALLALGAEIETRRGDVERRIPMADFYVLPAQRIDRETVLEHGEFVTGVVLPGAATAGRQFYRKLTQRGAWDFALVSIAGARRTDGSVRIAMGGVSPRPWRVPESVEEDVASGGLDEDSVLALADRAFHDAKPLSKNEYKVAMGTSLLREALRELAE